MGVASDINIFARLELLDLYKMINGKKIKNLQSKYVRKKIYRKKNIVYIW